MSDSPRNPGAGNPGPRDPDRTEDQGIDEAVEESFPASDPPAYGGVTGPVIDPLEELPPEEQGEAPHEVIRDWRGEFPLRGG
ncbi:hypothetical protein [Roseomonas elaeocarpi]|uniref:Uncharacterized protein n=1 Tax=Roseomonas elaeocarpi TaxID=907779 RepID=A0ABV6JYI4_9PROT